MTEAPLQRATFTVQPVPPFDFAMTADYATYFRGRNLWEFYENSVYRRVVELDGRLGVAAVRSLGDVDAPLLEVEVAAPSLDDEAVASAHRQVEWVLQTNVDLAPFYHMAEGDPFLAPLASMHRGFRVPQGTSVLEGLVNAILGQQISGQVARAVRTAVMEAYGETITVDGVEYRAFPRPQALAAAGIEGLRAQKLSWRKAEYVWHIASKEAAGEIDLEGLFDRSDEEVVETLTQLRGVGVWTAHWLLVRTLGRTDGFPHGDLAIQRTLGDVVNNGVRMTAEEALEYSLRWSPFRTYVDDLPVRGHPLGPPGLAPANAVAEAPVSCLIGRSNLKRAQS